LRRWSRRPEVATKQSWSEERREEHWSLEQSWKARRRREERSWSAEQTRDSGGRQLTTAADGG
jgi:hypothetical protein